MINLKVQLTEKIEEKLTQWDSYIQLRGKSGLYDIHKHSENNIRDILNILYDFKLENLGVHSPTFPIIDLGDSVNGQCFQVTANKSDKKYQELESNFMNSPLNLFEKYPTLNVFILSGFLDDRKGLLKALSKTGLTDDRIYDFKTILDQIRNLSNDENYKIDKILQILDRNYISYKYFDTAINSYKLANEQRFQLNGSFVEPHLIEEEKNPFRLLNRDLNHEENNEDEVRIYSQRELSKVTFSSAIKESTQIILTGDAGSGKSEVLKKAFQKKIKEVNEDEIPIYIDLGKSHSEKEVMPILRRELDRFVKDIEGISKPILIEELSKLLLNNNSVHLYFDGYDEMEKNSILDWNESIKTLLIHNPAISIVIAARRNRIFQDISLPINKVYCILPFDNEQIRQYISLMLHEHGQKVDEGRVKFIENSIATSKIFLTAPTMVIKMLIQSTITQKETDISVPNTKSEAYENYFKHIILKRIKTSGINDPEQTIPGLYKELVSEVFSILSLIAYINFNPSRSETLINFRKLDELLMTIEIKNQNSHLYQKGLNFLTKEIQIIIIEESRSYFNHFTYQEFFFAFWLKQKIKPSSPGLKWARSAYMVAKYNQVFHFLVGLMTEKEVEKFFDMFNKWPFRFWMRMIKPLDEITLSKFFSLQK